MTAIRQMSLYDIPSIVKIHLNAFTGFFLTSMGALFLKEFYSSILFDETHIAFVFTEKEMISGFVIGTTRPAGLYARTLIRFWYRFTWRLIQLALKNPAIILRLLKRTTQAFGANYISDEALLMSLAVLPEYEGQGVGRGLVNAFISEAHSRGIKKIFLTTDRNENIRANQFYQNMNFKIVRSFITNEEREMNEYCLEIT